MVPSDSDDREFYLLDPQFTDPSRLKKERAKARELRRSQWWRNQLQKGLCHYCGAQFPPDQLTLDHVVPLARGGRSTPGNCVPCCLDCNRKKGLETPVEQLFKKLKESGNP